MRQLFSSSITTALLTLCLSFVGMGAGCVQPTPPVTTTTPPPPITTNDWSSFTSPLLEYTIQYPTTWHTWSGSDRYDDMQDPETDVDYFSILPAEDSFTITADQVFIAIERDTKQTALDTGERETFADVVANNALGMTILDKQERSFANGLTGIQQREEDPRDPEGEYGYRVATYIDAGTVVYIIQVTTASAEDYARYAEMIDTMIASFAVQQ